VHFLESPIMPNDDSRQSLRASLRARRAALPPAARLHAAAAVAAQLARLPLLHSARRVAIYWAVAGELPLLHVTSALQAAGQEIYLPVVLGGGQLAFARWQTGADLKPNRFGIPEPVAADRVAANALDLALLPLLAFDRSGHRLGSGGGYYDRSFAFLANQSRPARPQLIGIAYAFQELPALTTAPWDIAVDFVASDAELIDCRTGHHP
jgi:5-formyltetrahydrofolate cyclo-ligase